MGILVLLALIVLAMTMANTPGLSAGWLWNSANFLGYLGLLLLAHLFTTPPQGRRHRIEGYVACAAVAVHAIALPAIDATLWHYLAPDGPAYMLAGLVALTCLLTLLVLALPAWRHLWRQRHRSFLRWHTVFGWLVLGLSGYHIWASGFYLSGPVETVALAGLAVLIIFRRIALDRGAGS